MEALLAEIITVHRNHQIFLF